MASFPQASPPTPFAHLYPPPYALHALPISFISIFPPAQYWVRCTDHLAPCYYMNSFKDRNSNKNWKYQAPDRTLWTPCACLLLVFLPCRMDCYKQVSTMLDHLYDQRTASSYSPSVTVGTSVPASQDAARLSQSEANDQVICCIFLFFLPLSVAHPPP